MSTVVRGLTFSKALLGLQAGERLQREGWNGKNMWIALGAGSIAFPAEKFWNPHAFQFAESNGGTATVDSYFIMKTAQGTIQMGWVPSQADMLANDWQTLVDEPKQQDDKIEVIHVFLDPNKPIAEQIEEAIKKITGERK
jgi:hypothetical protein